MQDSSAKQPPPRETATTVQNVYRHAKQYLIIYLFIYLFISLFIDLFISFFISFLPSLFIYLFIYLCLSATGTNNARKRQYQTLQELLGMIN